MLKKIAGQRPADRLMAGVRGQAYSKKTPLPTPDQVAIVLHALADHTAIMVALEHRPDPTSPWPQATSIGRWFHDVGDQLDPFPFAEKDTKPAPYPLQINKKSHTYMEEP